MAVAMLQYSYPVLSVDRYYVPLSVQYFELISIFEFASIIKHEARIPVTRCDCCALRLTGI